MADVHTTAIRSKNMAAIKGKNTKPEIKVRRYLHMAGYRYRLHYKIAGRPDIVFPSRRVAIFVHGCFWHCHTCQQFVFPKSNTEFWKVKLGQNVKRDNLKLQLLKSEGWRVAVLWECKIKKEFPSEMAKLEKLIKEAL